MRKQLQIVGGSNPGRFPKLSDEASWNLFPIEGGMMTYSGYESIGDIGEGEGRAFYNSILGGFAIAIIGDTVWRVNSFSPLSAANVGTLATSEGFCFIVENGNSEIAISDGAAYYVYTYSTPVGFVSFDVGFIPTMLAESLGYIFVMGQGNNFAYSKVNDALDFPLQNTGSIGSDRISGCANFNDWIFVFGQRSTKAWRTVGAPINPFQLDTSQIYQYGCLNPNSIASDVGVLAWFGITKTGNASIMAIVGGGAPQTVTTDGFDYLFSQLFAPSDCSALMWKQDGHTFYQLTFFNPQDNWSIVVDFTTKMFFYVTNPSLNMHIAKEMINFNQKYYFLSFIDNSIYNISSDIAGGDGEIIPAIRVTPPWRQESYKLIRYNKLEVIAEQGIGAQPMNMAVSFTSDNGNTSFDMPATIPFAPQGVKNWTCRQFMLGASRERAFQFRFDGIGRFVILSAYIEVNDADL
jgi:hypothetical protein